MTATVEARPTRAAPAPGRPDPRRRLRRVLFRLGVAPLVLALLLVVKVATMLSLSDSGRDDYAGGHYADAAGAFDSLLPGNVIEPWVAPYDLGTTRFQQGDYAAARQQLADALPLAPPEQECRVRTNLALADEALGDAALADGDVTAARTRWSSARGVLAAAGCTDEAASAAVRVDGRLAGKLTGAQVDPAEAPAPEGAETTLEERNARAEQRHRREEQRRQDLEDLEEQATDPPPGEPGEPPDYEW